MNPVLENILLGISLAAPLGPATIAIISSGLRDGFLTAIQVALGVIAADVTYVLVAYFGLAGLITIQPVKVGILIFGMFVLLYLGIRIIQGSSRPRELDPAQKPRHKYPFVEGYLVNLSNPLAVVWWLGMIGSILASADPNLSPLSGLLYPLTVVLGILIWHTMLSVLSHYGRRFFNPRVQKVISIISGIVLIGFALRFGYQALRELI